MPPREGTGWTTWPDLRNVLRRRWERGSYLGSHAAGLPFEPVDLPIRGPGPRDFGNRFDEVRAWHAGWSAVPRQVSVVDAPVGGRLIGVNRLPSRARIESFDDLCAVLGVRLDVETFDHLHALTAQRAPRLAGWMTSHPLRVLADAGSWPLLVTTVLWIEQSARPGSYLREIDVPGVDTKFVERHRGVLTDLLERQLPAERIDLTRSRSDFAGRYGFRNRPDYVRVRLPAGAPGPFTELAVRAEELAGAPIDAGTVLVVENEITYLALPPLPAAIVLGGGYAVGTLAPLRWLTDRDVVYWGDIDTHGYAILDRLRGPFPHIRSLLMDRATLLAHPTQWVGEPKPTREDLGRLTPDEAALYRDLVADALGPSVRLEQERIRPSWIRQALADGALGPSPDPWQAA